MNFIKRIFKRTLNFVLRITGKALNTVTLLTFPVANRLFGFTASPEPLTFGSIVDVLKATVLFAAFIAGYTLFGMAVVIGVTFLLGLVMPLAVANVIGLFMALVINNMMISESSREEGVFAFFFRAPAAATDVADAVPA